MAFLELMGRLPNGGESRVFNAMLVALVEHGITPSTLAARLTYLGAPDALQGAVAAGVLGLGTVFVGSIEGAARMLQEGVARAAGEEGLHAEAERVVSDFRTRREPIPGLGHPIHTGGDPRAHRLFQLAGEAELTGPHTQLLQLIEAESERRLQRPLPINVTGAIGAIASEMGIPWRICRGLGLMARPIGLVAHLLEEMEDPIARQVWERAEGEAERG
jgi:citrate synthase